MGVGQVPAWHVSSQYPTEISLRFYGIKEDLTLSVFVTTLSIIVEENGLCSIRGYLGYQNMEHERVSHKELVYVRDMISHRKIGSLFNVIFNDELILIGQHTGDLFVIYDGLITDSYLNFKIIINWEIKIFLFRFIVKGWH